MARRSDSKNFLKMFKTCLAKAEVKVNSSKLLTDARGATQVTFSDVFQAGPKHTPA